MPKSSIDPKNCCRVCGYDFGAPPWGGDGHCPEFWICPCCGSEAGYYDTTEKAVLMNRKRWVDAGAIWKEPKEKPDNWSLEEQLKQIPEEFK